MSRQQQQQQASATYDASAWHKDAAERRHQLFDAETVGPLVHRQGLELARL